MEYLFNTLSSATVAAVGTAAYYLYKNKDKITTQISQIDTKQDQTVQRDRFLQQLVKSHSPVKEAHYEPQLQQSTQRKKTHASLKLSQLVTTPSFDGDVIQNVRKTFDNKLSLNKQLLAFKIDFFSQKSEVITLINAFYEIFDQKEGIYQLNQPITTETFQLVTFIIKTEFTEFKIFNFTLNANIIVLELNYDNLPLFNFLDQQIVYLYELDQFQCIKNLQNFISSYAKTETESDELAEFLNNKSNLAINCNIFSYLAQKCELKCVIDQSGCKNVIMVNNQLFSIVDNILIEGQGGSVQQQIDVFNSNQLVGRELVENLKSSMSQSQKLSPVVGKDRNQNGQKLKNLEKENQLLLSQTEGQQKPVLESKKQQTSIQEPKLVVQKEIQQENTDIIPLEQLTQQFIEKKKSQQLSQTSRSTIQSTKNIKQLQDKDLKVSKQPSRISYNPTNITELKSQSRILSPKQIKTLDISQIISRRTTDSTITQFNNQQITKIYKTFDESFFPDNTLLNFKPNYLTAPQIIQDLFSIIYNLLSIGKAEITLKSPLKHDDFSYFYTLLNTDFQELYYLSFSQTEDRLNIHLSSPTQQIMLNKFILTSIAVVDQIQNQCEKCFKIHKFITSHITKTSISKEFSNFAFGSSNQEVSNAIFSIIAQNCKISSFLECNLAVCQIDGVQYQFDSFNDSLAKNSVIMWQNCGKYNQQILYFQYFNTYFEQENGIKYLVSHWKYCQNAVIPVYIENDIDQDLVLAKIEYYYKKQQQQRFDETYILMSKKHIKNTFFLTFVRGTQNIIVNYLFESSQSYEVDCCDDLSDESVKEIQHEDEINDFIMSQEKQKSYEIIQKQEFIYPFHFKVEDNKQYHKLSAKYKPQLFEYEENSIIQYKSTYVQQVYQKKTITDNTMLSLQLFDILIDEIIVYQHMSTEFKLEEFYDQLYNDVIIYTTELLKSQVPNPDFFFDCKIDEIIIYKTLMSKNEIPRPIDFFDNEMSEMVIYSLLPTRKHQKLDPKDFFNTEIEEFIIYTPLEYVSKSKINNKVNKQPKIQQIESKPQGQPQLANSMQPPFTEIEEEKYEK